MNGPLSIDQVSYPCLNDEHDLCELGDECACSCEHPQSTKDAADTGARRRMSLSDRVRLGHDGRRTRWWTVQAIDDRFVVLTRPAPFQPRGTVEYTIIDWERGLRGPCNLIGQGWDFPLGAPRDGAELLLAALNAKLTNDAARRADHARNGTNRWPPTELEVEVSHRNNVPIEILGTSSATTAGAA